MSHVSTPGISAGTTPGATANEPAGFASTISGVAFADGSCAWVSEMYPQDYLVGHTYRPGDRIFIPGLNWLYFECTVGGVSAIAATDRSFVAATYMAGSSPAQEKFVDAKSGVLTWLPKAHAGMVISCSQFSVDRCYVKMFTCAAYYCFSTTDLTPKASTDLGDFSKCYAKGCGMGWYLTGTNSNGIRLYNPRGYHLAPGRSTVDSDYGAGGNLVRDRGLVNVVYGGYAQERAGGGCGPAYVSLDLSRQCSLVVTQRIHAAISIRVVAT
jgi:hypothetical protein